MKKTPLLNIALSRVIASLGHGDILMIVDAGMPVPAGVELVDLALTRGVPDFVSVLDVVLSEMQVESHVLANEMAEVKPPALQVIESLNLDDQLGQQRWISHEDLKVLSRKARAIIRTGECQPYSNVALVSGVVF
ncbi:MULTISPECIES: D-ribose pyranase [Pseudomonas syringae group]|uniref:D-ribose pyranase n=1 Tax=Pseudomonas amygdali pv. hibisci TaxID=251723 RepID=A0AB34UB59_PSEA0|nr:MULTISPECIES: D-ribose pyranase [Pseudomonas syringae group]KPB36615.1 D-ribose pyranase [Pseudomonas amygdali pv. sesami]KPX57241.1 D-ribose pyranase [Pseudomonas amygdali pv. hibisci]MDU8605812.1 D-ribose pyranase [Pseudomonas syringae group sp. 247E2]MDU8648490.1 D-ribose pyranase [Pseudomonas syringae group sp. 26L6]RMN61842.1 D-ribose pyranase [Pseudomonas amygdali pv. hibisci]